MKKIFAMFLVLAFPCVTVFAADDNVGETLGYVAEIYGDVIHIVGEPLTDGAFCEVLVRVGDAPVYDLRTGFRVCASEIRKDMDARVAYFLDDEPGAVVVWLNWDYDDAAVFTVTASENITVGAEGTVFLCAGGRYRVALFPDTIILCPHHGPLSHCDVAPGMEFFVWVDMITASTPASVYPDKVVLVY